MRLRQALIASLLVLVSAGSAAAGAARPAAQAVALPPLATADTSLRPPMTLQQQFDRADTLVARRGGARAENARLYLTWNAPYGMPRASRTHTPMSRNPTAVDTLWLSFLPGRAGEGFISFGAELYFRAAQGDTLGPWWHMNGDGQNKGALSADFGPDASFPQRQPWTAIGFGAIRMYRTAASARVSILFAVPYTGAVPINPDSVYTLCRVMLRHQRVLPGCSQPVCVEWASASLGYGLRDEPTVNRGERFVSYASDESVCGSFLPMKLETHEARPAARPAHAPTRAPRRKPSR